MKKKIWGLVSEKPDAELNERVEAATSSHSGTGKILQYIILCLWLRFIRRSDQGGYEFSCTDIFLIPFYTAVASYCY